MKPDLIAPAWYGFRRLALPRLERCSRDELARLIKAVRLFAEHLEAVARARTGRKSA